MNIFLLKNIFVITAVFFFGRGMYLQSKARIPILDDDCSSFFLSCCRQTNPVSTDCSRLLSAVLHVLQELSVSRTGELSRLKAVTTGSGWKEFLDKKLSL
jgi:hypothetical protein